MYQELDWNSGWRFAPLYLFVGVPTTSSSSIISVVMCSMMYFTTSARKIGMASPANFL